MQRVVVTVQCQGGAQARDLEVPAEVESERLGKMIAQALHWDTGPAGQPVEYEIMAEPPGRTLQPHESLADVGAWDGAWLVFQRRNEPACGLTEPVSPPAHPLSPALGGPVTSWRPLGIDLPDELEPEGTPPQDTGFAWKQLD